MKTLLIRVAIVFGFAMVVSVPKSEAVPGGGGGGGGGCKYCKPGWFQNSWTCANGGGGSGCVFEYISKVPLVLICHTALGPCSGPSIGGIAP